MGQRQGMSGCSNKKGSTGHLCGDGIVLYLDFAGSILEIHLCRKPNAD